MFNRKPKKIINGVNDFIENIQDEFVDNYELMAKDRNYLKHEPSTEINIMVNLCQTILSTLTLFYPIKNIIDVGCGFGHILNNIDIECTKIGIDISINRLSNLNDEIIKIRSFAENIPIIDNFSDIVICTDLFEHVQDIEGLSSEINRILKPNGFLLFAVPWKQNLDVYNLKEYAEKFKRYEYGHLRSVNEKSLNKCFKNFDMICDTNITEVMKNMIFEPYYVKFIVFRKKV